MSLSEFRHPALSRKELDEAIPSVAEAVQPTAHPIGAVVKTQVAVTLVGYVLGEHVTEEIPAFSEVTIIGKVDDTDWSSYVITTEVDGARVAGLIAQVLVEGV